MLEKHKVPDTIGIIWNKRGGDIVHSLHLHKADHKANVF